MCHARLLITGIRGGGCKAMCSLLPGDILIAADRIKPYIRRTPLEYSHWLSEGGNSRIYVKLGEGREADCEFT